jgi:hypothetical protein
MAAVKILTHLPDGVKPTHSPNTAAAGGLDEHWTGVVADFADIRRNVQRHQLPRPIPQITAEVGDPAWTAFPLTGGTARLDHCPHASPRRLTHGPNREECPPAWRIGGVAVPLGDLARGRPAPGRLPVLLPGLRPAAEGARRGRALARPAPGGYTPDQARQLFAALGPRGRYLCAITQVSAGLPGPYSDAGRGRLPAYYQQPFPSISGGKHWELLAGTPARGGCGRSA